MPDILVIIFSAISDGNEDDDYYDHGDDNDNGNGDDNDNDHADTDNNEK